MSGNSSDKQEEHVQAEEPVDAPGPEKRRKVLVAEALYSMEILRERHGFLEFLTSFDEPEIKLLIKRFSEVCCCVFFFFRFLRFCHVARSRSLVFTSQFFPC
jgi:hypothetical protein